ncbi:MULTISPECIES: MetQ/NlpA family ABC transporter substrate-binding protein [Campylobacter]|uniref:DL-methionine ABC transporter MetINQ, substrate-binding protein n=1 Tax=Campylobacter curvus (strain 525.92) TaxID=360105 RepID=A7GYE8_CAMC5|nr:MULTISPECIES: MetQ/NlpA family ABC transporter substrate-binding protein [Campylobacter]EAU00136.1 DL-methionine ABC transporter MetINQ, substrate-binding protein [Campylobacter curvus 525.92]EJP75317.1 NLPA lipoprotein [Campylobacter sp. FOBRC14]
MKILNLLAATFLALNLYAKSDDKTIIVGVSPVPHAEILEFVKPKLKELGYDLVISEITDYSIPNIATQDGDLDANFFQHLPYLEEQNKNRGLNLVKVASVHVEPLGFYSKNIKNINELKDGATVAIAYDPSNGNRALRILEKAGLIELDKKAVQATPHDITKNPLHLKFVELEGAQIPRTLDEVDLAAISTNFVLDLGMSVAKDALLLEDANSPYANIIVTRAGNENSPKIKALVKAVLSDDTRKFILDRYKGEVIPAF